MPSCVCCGNVDEPHRLVNCCICKKTYRIDCAGISVSEARKIHSRTGFSWTCKDCLKFGDDLNDLKSFIVCLQDEIKILKESLLTTTTLPRTSLVDKEEIIQEIIDRDRRKNNIIIFGSVETKCNSNSEQVNLDTKLVGEICSTLLVADTNIKVSRLGKFDPTAIDRKRPLRVSFNSESIVGAALRNASKLKTNSNLSGLSISRDRTPMQLKIHRDARAELDNRLKNGEKNLKIQYKNGIPHIVSSLN